MPCGVPAPSASDCQQRPPTPAYVLFAPGHAWRAGARHSELAGHQDLTTTQRYMHLRPAAIEAAIHLPDQPKNGRERRDMLETREVKKLSDYVRTR
jgi:hypothetical protein